MASKGGMEELVRELIAKWRKEAEELTVYSGKIRDVLAALAQPATAKEEGNRDAFTSQGTGVLRDSGASSNSSNILVHVSQRDSTMTASGEPIREVPLSKAKEFDARALAEEAYSRIFDLYYKGGGSCAADLQSYIERAYAAGRAASGAQAISGRIE